MRNPAEDSEPALPNASGLRLVRETLKELAGPSLLGVAGGSPDLTISYGHDTRPYSTGNVQCPNRELCE